MSHCPVGHERFETLRALCLRETTTALSASGLLRWLPARSLIYSMAGPSTRFAERLARFDRAIAERGLAAAAADITAVWATALRVEGPVPIASRRPTVIVANHPGLIDAVALLSCLGGHDIRVLAAHRPMLSALPALSDHLIAIGPTAGQPRRALLAARRHLSTGGTLVVFPAGRIEPDPKHAPGLARAALAEWSPSAVWLARHAAEATIVPTAISGVIAPNARRRLWVRAGGRDVLTRDWLAATAQALQPGRYPIRPRVCFAAPLAGAEASPAALAAAMTGLYDG